jgi:L-threonylcarbamoyladenylate synthase
VSDELIEPAVRILLDGGLVALPTETVYGLGADATNPVAVRRIFEVKGRPLGHPLIVHVSSGRSLDAWAAYVPEPARLLVERFWPGPLTLVLARRGDVPDVVTGGRDTVALRAPDHPMAQDLLHRLDGRTGGSAGIAAPSANRFGRVSPTTAAHVRADLGGDVDLILDGGPSRVGVESTIVDLSADRPVVLRLGGVTVDALAEVLGERPEVADVWTTPQGEGPKAPGMSVAHYAPRARVVLVDDVGAFAQELVIRLVGEALAKGERVAVLAPGVVDGLPPDAVELEPVGPADHYAQVLYDRLRQADRLGVDVIVAVPPGPGGLGESVRDRLSRAAVAGLQRTDTDRRPPPDP